MSSLLVIVSEVGDRRSVLIFYSCSFILTVSIVMYDMVHGCGAYDDTPMRIFILFHVYRCAMEENLFRLYLSFKLKTRFRIILRLICLLSYNNFS